MIHTLAKTKDDSKDKSTSPNVSNDKFVFHNDIKEPSKKHRKTKKRDKSPMIEKEQESNTN